METATKTRKRVKPTPDHLARLAQGRSESAVVRNYLVALDGNRPRRGRPVTTENLETRLKAVEEKLQEAKGADRLQLVQDRFDLQDRIASLAGQEDLTPLEENFVKVAAAYAARKKISYAAFREVGVEPGVLKKAGISRAS